MLRQVWGSAQGWLGGRLQGIAVEWMGLVDREERSSACGSAAKGGQLAAAVEEARMGHGWLLWRRLVWQRQLLVSHWPLRRGGEQGPAEDGVPAALLLCRRLHARQHARSPASHSHSHERTSGAVDATHTHTLTSACGGQQQRRSRHLRTGPCSRSRPGSWPACAGAAPAA